jgi:hypothetical protein
MFCPELASARRARPVEVDSPSIAKCACPTVLLCPRHRPKAYSMFSSKHRAPRQDAA